MIVLENYIKTTINPLQSVNPDDFGVKQWNYDVDNQGKYLAKWDETKKLFEFFNFDKKLLWNLNAPICKAKFDPENQLVWLVQRDGNEQVTVFVYDYKGNQKAGLTMEDELYQSTFIITLLPEPMSIALDFGGGQDGLQTYFLQFKKDKMHIVKKLEADLCLLFTFENDQKAVLLNYYENTIFTVSYPDLEPLEKFILPDEMSYGNLSKITDSTWLFTDDQHYRHYLLDSKTMKIGEEIVVYGYEPTPDEENELCSSISNMQYRKGKIIFTHWEITGKYPDIKHKYWWGEADFNI